jgi:hypothetical protein
MFEQYREICEKLWDFHPSLSSYTSAYVDGGFETGYVYTFKANRPIRVLAGNTDEYTLKYKVKCTKEEFDNK